MLGGDPKAGREEVTDEEIRAMVSGSSTLGDEERRIVDDVFDAGSRGLREVMLPRTEVDFLPGDMPAHKAVREVLKAPHSRYPVMGDSADDIIGFVHVRDLLDPEISNRTTPVSEVARPVLSLPDTVRVLRALSDMRRARAHLAIVLDEYGGTAGIVTMEDLVEELVGDITDEYDVVVGGHHRAPRGDLVVDGLTTLDEFAEQTGYMLAEGPYDTVAGYFMARLGQLPSLNATRRGRGGAGHRVRPPRPPAGAAGDRAGRPAGARRSRCRPARSANRSRRRRGEPTDRGTWRAVGRRVRPDVCPRPTGPASALPGPAHLRLAAPRQLPGGAAAVGADAGGRRGVLRRRRPACADRRTRTRTSAEQSLLGAAQTARRRASTRRKPTIFLQSQVPEHTQLAWILELPDRVRAGQPDDAVQGQGGQDGAGAANVGLFTYPVLMAADILLYQADQVPVGEDQRQHLELTRDLAVRFNARYGATFTVPEPYIVALGRQDQGSGRPDGQDEQVRDRARRD